jgi:hypothetical protein
MPVMSRRERLRQIACAHRRIERSPAGMESATRGLSMRRPDGAVTSSFTLALLSAGMLLTSTAPAQPAPSAQPAAPVLPAPSPVPAPPLAAKPPPYILSLQKGQQLMAAGRYVEASHELASALRGSMADQAAPPGVAYHIAGVLQQARSRIAIIRIEADAERQITVDGTGIGEAPIVGEILLAPGKHRVIARGPLCLGTVDADVAAGETRFLEVPCVTAPRWRTPALIGGLVGAVAGLAAGGIALGVSEDKHKALDRFGGEARDRGFAEPWMTGLVETLERERVDWLNASITGFLIGGGLLAATTAVFFGVKRHRPDEPPPLVGVTVGVGQAGLWMRW